MHTDAGLLPRRPRAWASWNYHLPADDDKPVAVTYDVNRLQRLGAPGPICVTLNYADQVADAHRLRTITYQHPVFGPGRYGRSGPTELNGQQRSYFCGAYWGYGFHEDGVRSALDVCRCFGRTLDSCTVVSTAEPCDIGVSSV